MNENVVMVWNKNHNLGYEVTNDVLSIRVDATDHCDLSNFIPLNGEGLSYDSHTWDVYGHSELNMIHILNSLGVSPDEEFQEINIYEVDRNYPKNSLTLRCSIFRRKLIPYVSCLYH
jgi:hypothetical protein